MHTHYGDILDRISDPPKWIDERAVPRYCDFSPNLVAFIYAKEAALVLIQCQACAREFQVAFSEINANDRLHDGERKHTTKIAELIAESRLHYGDPPNVKCCSAGATMNSVPVRVLEYWYKPIIRGEGMGPHPKLPNLEVITDIRAFEFTRDHALELDILPDWAR